MEMTLLFLIPAIFLPFFSVVNGREVFYQQVNGKCDDLLQVRNYSTNKIASGEWFHQYYSYGQPGDRCGSGHALERGNMNYVDIMVYDPTSNSYEVIPDDLLYHPEMSGTYTNAVGALCHVLATDDTSYVYIIQCMLDSKGKTRVMGLFATRQRQITPQEQAAYDYVSEKLASKNLLPRMFKMLQTNCPPEYMIKYEKNV